MTALPDFKLRDRGNKWLVRSALQKAVRRGRAQEALFAGGYLFNEDAAYFWKSMAVIAIEDVGVANVEAVTAVFDVRNTGKAHPKYADREAIGEIIEDLCAGTKSRACCELSVGAEYGSPDLFYELCNRPTKLVGYATDFNDPVKAYAAWALVFGVHKSNPKPINGLVLELKDWVMKQGWMSEHQQTFLLNVLHNPVDSMVAAAPVVMALWMAEPHELVHDSFPPEAVFKSVSSAAMDMHTADGKKALMAFHTSLSKKYPTIAMIPKDTAVRALGAVVFVLEGGLVDKRVTSKLLAPLKELQDKQLMIGYGVPEKILPTVVEIVGSEFDRLNQKRDWVVHI